MADPFDESIVSERQTLIEQAPVHLHHAAAGRRGGAFDDALQLAHATRPPVGAQTFDRLVGNVLDDGPEVTRMLAREETGEFRDVLTAFDK